MRIFRPFIRVSAFLTKEIAEVLRQPRLILTLVLGPFLILALFGIGYRNQARALRTLFVLPPGSQNSQISQQIQQYATTLGPQLIYEGTTTDQQAAETALRNHQVDLVVLVPQNPYQAVQNNQQATFTLLHNEIDPIQVDYIKYFGEVYIGEVNRRVLTAMAQQGQQDAAGAQKDVQAARQNAAALHSALQAGDQATARQQQQSLNQNVGAAELALGATASLLGSVQDTPGGGPSTLPAAGAGQAAGSTAGGSASTGNSGNLRSDLQGIRQETNSLSNAGNGGDTASQAQQAAKLESDLARLDNELTTFRNIDPKVLVQPFQSKTESIAQTQPSLSDYFGPGVIVLLLQHLALTFAALSIVREIRLGSMELFRVSPVSAFETLVGKYLSYLIFAGILAAALSLLLIFGLRVPMLGDPWWYAASLAALLFTSLGLGFVISLVSQTDSQAVQYAMIALLCSVFFSGFMLSLNSLIPGVRVISWLIPATYGISLLQDIMLRGVIGQLYLLYILAGIGLFLFILAWILLRRRMASA